jgi:hypothetical protein
MEKQELTEQEITLELAKQAEKSQLLEQSLAKLRNAKVLLEIEKLLLAALKRQEAAESEKMVLAELARARAQREADEKAEQERVIAEQRKQAQQRQEQAQQEESHRRTLAEANRKLREEADHVHRLELEQKAILLDLQRGMEPEPEHPKPATLDSTPMGRIFSPKDVNGNTYTLDAIATVPHEISLTEHMQNEARKAKEAEALAPKLQGPRPVDANECSRLRSEFKRLTQEMLNLELAQSILSNTSASRAYAALEVVAREHVTVRRMSVQEIVTRTQRLCESTDEIQTPEPVIAPVGGMIACEQCGSQVGAKLAYHYNSGKLCVRSPRLSRAAGVLSASDCDRLEAERRPQ